MDKEIDKLDFNNLKEGIEYCLRNSIHLNACAKQLSETSNYDVATSLVILSCEESIKTAVLISRHFGVESDIPIKKFFRDHNIKHDEIVKILNLLNSIEILINISSFSKKGIAKALSSFSDLLTPRNSEWWKDANSLKQTGFYVDFNKGNWIVPSQLTKEGYLKASNHADLLLKWLTKASSIIANDNFKLSNTMKG